MNTAYLNALDKALELPTVPREQPINVGQLRMLAEIANAPHGLDRFELLDRETHDKPTVDARIKYLRNKDLITATQKGAYHDSAKFCVTSLGASINNALQGQRSPDLYKCWLDHWIDLPIKKREAPVNVGLLKVYALIESNPDITTTDLLEHFPGSKPTLTSRLKWLRNKKLIKQYPKYNAGGAGNPAYYRVNKHQTRLGAEV